MPKKQLSAYVQAHLVGVYHIVIVPHRQFLIRHFVNLLLRKTSAHRHQPSDLIHHPSFMSLTCPLASLFDMFIDSSHDNACISFHCRTSTAHFVRVYAKESGASGYVWELMAGAVASTSLPLSCRSCARWANHGMSWQEHPTLDCHRSLHPSRLFVT